MNNLKHKRLMKNEIDASVEHVESLRDRGHKVLTSKVTDNYIKYECKDENGFDYNSYIMRTRAKMTKDYMSNCDSHYAYTINIDSELYDLIVEIFRDNGYLIELFECIWVMSPRDEYHNLNDFNEQFNRLYREIKFNYIK